MVVLARGSAAQIDKKVELSVFFLVWVIILLFFVEAHVKSCCCCDQRTTRIKCFFEKNAYSLGRMPRCIACWIIRMERSSWRMFPWRMKSPMFRERTIEKIQLYHFSEAFFRTGSRRRRREGSSCEDCESQKQPEPNRHQANSKRKVSINWRLRLYCQLAALADLSCQLLGSLSSSTLGSQSTTSSSSP